MLKICKITQKEFEITEKDLEFYDKMGVPAPTICPEERQRRRLSWQNMYNLYHVECRATGKKIISSFADSSKYNVFDMEYWWSDKWDFKNYWIDFDYGKKFFEQYDNLLKTTPLPALFTNYENDVNSDYTNYAWYDKNCYLIFHADENEDCCFATGLKRSKKCFDSLNVFDWEQNYECIDCQSCFNLQYSQDCNKCSDSYFLRNCEWCSFCFGSINQINQKYVLFNKQVTEEEYKKFISNFDSWKRHIIDLVREKFSNLEKKSIHKNIYWKNNEKCEWDHIFNCKEVLESFDVKESRNMKFCERIYNWPNADCYDVDQFGLRVTRMYETINTWVDCNNVRFSWYSYNLINCDYVMFGFNLEDCFACIWLKNQKYCIFNKQYSKEEYFELKEKIIEHMKSSPQPYPEWGEFFPSEISPYWYNESIAQEYFPLTEKEILNLWFNYKKEQEQVIYNWAKIEVENDISDINTDILKKILTCKNCDKNYRLVEPEYNFYKEKSIPVPLSCPSCRHLERTKKRNPRKLFDRKCDKCSCEIKSTFDKNREEVIYCEECFERKVY